MNELFRFFKEISTKKILIYGGLHFLLNFVSLLLYSFGLIENVEIGHLVYFLLLLPLIYFLILYRVRLDDDYSAFIGFCTLVYVLLYTLNFVSTINTCWQC